MANEKSRNHETGGGKGSTSKHQGKPDDQDSGAAGSKDAKRTDGESSTSSGDKGGEAAPRST